MTLVRLNTLRNFPSFNTSISRVFDDFFTEPEHRGHKALNSWHPVVDIHETETSTFISADIPGVKKEEISINVEENTLVLSGERKTDIETKKENYYRAERSFGKFRREFSLPASIDHEKISADYKDGVLTIEIPKPEEQKPKSIAIH